MVGCSLRCLICFFACSSVSLLGPSLNDVEASSCQRVIHKKVGDTVELPSCLPADGLPADGVATWYYGGLPIADKDGTFLNDHQFKDRFYLNPTNFSLTLRKLTLQDSGNFSFVSADSHGQRGTVIITLQVHETITQNPVLTSNSTWYNSNESCVVLLECSTAIPNISYNWTVGNQIKNGSSLQYSVRPQDGQTKFTCTIYNFVSKMSASVMVECSNETGTTKSPGPGLNHIILLAAAGGGCLLLIIILVIAVGVCYCRRTQSGGDFNDHTVYADITEVTHESQTSFPMKPSSVYETVEETVQKVTPGPQTVYDKIQLSRVRKQSVSPYQEIS